MVELVRHLRISGRVQGVGYRAWFERRAKELALSGWVRNRRDGTVEAVVAGTTEAVGEMIRLAHDGPPWAAVDCVSEEMDAVEPGSGFRVERTV